MTIRYSLGRVASDLAAILQTRAELFSVELALQRERFFSLLSLCGIACIFLLLALVIFSILFISFYWPGEFRLWAIGGLALTYTAIVLGALWLLFWRLKTEALPFELSRKEFTQDLTLLSAWCHTPDKTTHNNQDRAEQHER